ncbi:DUF305 domain-containing protein [Microbacterium awajiense]|uniref:DUF305 domain-containing protein n=1 Tax=Microbacterium awajiense TaxID=415214 RepID=A0ABP7AY07_9MICO
MRRAERSAASADRRGFLVGSVVALAGVGLTACASGAATADAAVPNDADLGFCTDMAFHHEQAVAMCQRVLGADTGGAVQNSAAEILQNQSYERGLMHAWLAEWGQSTAPPDTVMGWMGMETPAASMPGLATHAQMRRLAELTGIEKGREFLELMRAHHVGGVHMADAAVDAVAITRVSTLAQQMSRQQTYEISLFDDLLTGLYA